MIINNPAFLVAYLPLM